ncbi:hypothetical protein TNCV_788311 [Trichonephila clavipes]|nr:hypothetical protein TNCV_788311 [Trichonephila clavipes]
MLRSECYIHQSSLYGWSSVIEGLEPVTRQRPPSVGDQDLTASAVMYRPATCKSLGSAAIVCMETTDDSVIAGSSSVRAVKNVSWYRTCHESSPVPLHVKSRDFSRWCGMVVRREEYRCHPRHLTMVQKVRRRAAEQS